MEYIDFESRRMQRSLSGIGESIHKVPRGDNKSLESKRDG